MSTRERVVAGGLSLAFLLAAGTVAALAPWNRHPSVLTLAMLVALAVVANRVVFEVGSNEVSPDQLVFIPMLFIAPLPLVPVLTALALVIASMSDVLRRRVHPDRWLYAVAAAWPTIGATAVVAALAPGHLQAHHAWVYALALVAQSGIVIAVAVANEFLIHGIAVREAFSLAVQCCRIDAVLTPVVYMVAAVGEQEPLALLSVVPVLWLLQVFSAERRERFAAALELNQAYRGTVMVLSDVVEAEDNYTASHCRSVVELAAAVGDELGLDHRSQQELEIAALLHDVGKIAIPNEILNKPAKLTDDEFALMKTHTIEGQALLDRVGGRLARVGEIVRSCHERWDGGGYPDGLAGEQIPVAARIVFCCDAYSAMTTDRPYRAAMSQQDALAELRANAGTQFEPRVVDALEKVVWKFDTLSQGPYTDALRAVLATSPAAAVEQPAAV